MLRRVQNDPRAARCVQLRPKMPLVPPKNIQRMASAAQRWNLPRSLSLYRAEKDTTIAGAAPKWVLRGAGGDEDFYIAKFGSTNGHIETFTELFNNQLALALDLRVAHSGLVSLDGQPYFVTRNFRAGEQLIHGGFLVAEVLGEKEEELEQIKRPQEQQFFDIELIQSAIQQYCGAAYASVWSAFLEMLAFDGLIGAADRHLRNWGVLRPQTTDKEEAMRLAPIYDSARALLWDLTEDKLLKMDADASTLEVYVRRAKPHIGVPGQKQACDHFGLLAELLARDRHPTAQAVRKVADAPSVDRAARILSGFPFDRGFSAVRKRVLLKVLLLRRSMLCELQKG